jgi:hypothetical protein
MTGQEMLDQFYDQMEQRPEVRNEFLFWYFDCIVPTMPADCVRFSDFSAIRGNPAIVKRMGKVRFVAFAVACAERRLKMFESQYPNDDRPRKAIRAARRYVKSPTKAAASAAYAAASAASAAYAAYAAERKWQSDKLRKIIGRNPFASLDKG